MRVLLSAILIACMSATSTLHAVSVRKADVSPKSILVDTKQVPNEINYQGWLGDAADSAGFSGTPAMIFNMYTVPTGGVASWSETHMAVPVDKGIFHVLLGATTPLTTDLFAGTPLWLETIVGVDTLKPRKKMVSVAYAIRADSADKAYDSYLWDGNKWGVEYPKANKADTAAYAVGGGGAAYADSAGHLVGPDVIKANTTGAALTVRNESGTGTGLIIQTPTISGTNVSLKIENNPDTAIYLDSGGYYGLVIGSLGQDAIKINRSAYGRGIHILVAEKAGVEIDSVTQIGLNVKKTGEQGLYIGYAGQHGIKIDECHSSYTGVWLVDAGHNGFAVGNAGSKGVWVGTSGSDGCWVNNAGDDGFEVVNAANNGVYIGHAGRHGVYVANADTNGIFVESARQGLYIDSVRYDGVYIYKAVDDGITIANAGDYGIYIGNTADDGIYVANSADKGVCAKGKRYGGYFRNDTTGTNYPALYVKNLDGSTSSHRIANFYGGTTQRFYFRGDGWAYADGGWNIFKKGGKAGATPYHTIQSRDVEIVASGTAKLSNGSATIALDQEIRDFVSGNVDLRITTTPKGSWSGLYVAQQSNDQFVVKSDAGNLNADFDWIVIAREKGFDVRTELSQEEIQSILHPSPEPEEMKTQESEEQEPVIRLSKQTEQEIKATASGGMRR
jgi:hypothetical protein